jgi:hypothetical protein|tara:strand:- start:1564 stop:1860 length:297 start_codon:yes stop_codon:yes gene_type:complete
MMSNLGESIKKSPFKTLFFMNKLKIKPSFFYKKMRNNSFTITEFKTIAPYLYENEQKKHEKEVINNLLRISKEEMKGKQTRDFTFLLEEAKNLYALQS